MQFKTLRQVIQASEIGLNVHWKNGRYYVANDTSRKACTWDKYNGTCGGFIDYPSNMYNPADFYIGDIED